MSTLGSINVKIGADTAGLVAGTNRARDAMGRFIPLARQAGDAVARASVPVVQFGADAEKMAFRAGQAIGSVGKAAISMAGTVASGAMAAGAAMEKFGGRVRDVGNHVSSLGQSLSIGLTAPLGAASVLALKASGDMEQAQISFTTLLGSAQKAGSYIRDLQSFAASTPFDFQGVRQGAQQLMAFGFQAKDVIPMLTSIGDGLSAMGNTSTDAVNRAVVALGQMKASGTVLKEDLNQLIALNIPVFDILQQKLGLTAQQVARIGESGVESGKAIDAILSGLNDRFGGSMAKQSQTLLGLWSTLKDQASFIFIDIGNSIADALDLRSRAQGIISGLESIQSWFKSLSAEAKQTAVGVGVFAASLGPALMIAGQVVTALGSFVMVLGFIATPMGLVVAGAVAFTAAMADALISSKALRDNLMSQWPELKGALGQAWSGMQAAAHAAMLAMRGDWDGFSSEMSGAMTALGGAMNRLWGVAIAALEPVLVSALDRMISRVLSAVASLPGKALEGLGMLVSDRAFYAFASDADIARLAPKRAGGGLLGGIGTGTSDSNLFWGSRGEMVINAEQTRRFYPLLNAINAKKFATGGVIGGNAVGGGVGVDPAWARDQAFAAMLAQQTAENRATLAALERLSQVNSGAALERLGGDMAARMDRFGESLGKAESGAADLAESLHASIVGTEGILQEFADGVGAAEKGFEWLDKPDAADAWAYQTEEVKKCTEGVRQFADSAIQAAESVQGAVGALPGPGDLIPPGASDFEKSIWGGITPEMQRHQERMADILQTTEFKIEAAGETMAQKIKGVAGSFVANVEGMFPSLKNAQKLFDGMNKSAWTLQNGNTFFDFGALKAMQEGNLRLLAVMEKGGEALNSEWLDSLLGTSAAWGDSLAGQSAAIGQATAAQDVATESTRAMSDSLIQATDSVSGSLVAAGEGMLASASATAAAGQWMANTFLANGMVVNRAAASMSAGLASASSGVLAAASAAVSAIGSQLAQIGAGSGLSELAQQMQNAGLTGAVESTLPGGSPSGLESSSGSMGSSRGNGRNGGGWVSGGYGQLPPIVLVLDGQQIHTSVQSYSNYYGASNVSGGIG